MLKGKGLLYTSMAIGATLMGMSAMSGQASAKTTDDVSATATAEKANNGGLTAKQLKEATPTGDPSKHESALNGKVTKNGDNLVSMLGQNLQGVVTLM